MSVPSPFLKNSFSYFLLITYKVLTSSVFGPFNNKKLPSVKPKLNSAIGVD